MEKILVALIITNILSLILLLYKSIKNHKTKTLGVIYVLDKGQMYIELDSPDSEAEIHNSKYVTFEVRLTQK